LKPLNQSVNLADKFYMRASALLISLLAAYPRPAAAFDWSHFRPSHRIEDRRQEANVTPKKLDASVGELKKALGAKIPNGCEGTKVADAKESVRKDLQSAKKAAEILSAGDPTAGMNFTSETAPADACSGAFVAQEAAIRRGQLELEKKFVALRAHYQEPAKKAGAMSERVANFIHRQRLKVDASVSAECLTYAKMMDKKLQDFGVNYSLAADSLQSSWKRLQASADSLIQTNCQSRDLTATPSGRQKGSVSSTTPSGKNGSARKETETPGHRENSYAQDAVDESLKDFVSGALKPGKLGR
jgi:hypothetical protein